MRPIFFLSVLIALVFTSCGGNDQNVDAETAHAAAVPNVYAAAITALEEGKGPAEVSRLLMDNFQAVSNPTTGELNPQACKDFVSAATQLSDKFPSDTLAAMPLYRAAEVVRAMNDPQLTANIYRKVYDNYPAFSKAPEALFMLGFTYDEDLEDLEKAKATYNDFLQKHPNHSFADDTEMLLKNLGKSDEEILKELEAKGIE